MFGTTHTHTKIFTIFCTALTLVFTTQLQIQSQKRGTWSFSTVFSKELGRESNRVVPRSACAWQLLFQRREASTTRDYNFVPGVPESMFLIESDVGGVKYVKTC